MRVRFLATVNNGHQIIKPGWVLEVSDTEGAALISAGKAEAVSNRTACRKGTSHLYDGCAPKKQQEPQQEHDEHPEAMHIRHLLTPKKRK